ncbi:MAG TPA: glutathione S-transferase [Steroidobacteraceae bacterium]|nr:glutathione S-transferase [Steroidobacteraceae bacterium]
MTALITYFDVRGRAEVIRLIHEETATPYRERRIAVSEWPALKPTLPFGQMPTYEDGDLFIVQSHAIYRYLARKHNLYGANEREHVRCDIVEEAFVDAQNAIGGFYWNPEFAKKRDEFAATTLTDLLGKLQRLFEQNANSEYWVGNQLTLADFVAWHSLDYVRPFSQKTLDQFEKLNAFKKYFEARPRIAAYLRSDRRPKTLTVAMAPFGGTPETS